MNRRQALFAGATPILWTLAKGLPSQRSSSRLSVEGYIWQQYAERQNKPLADVLDEIFPMAHNAGFHNVELNQTFFTPELRSHVERLLRANDLAMPSVYVGGVMHEEGLAEQTTRLAFEIATICQPFGCRAVINNPDPKPGQARKSDAELAVQVKMLDRLGRQLRDRGFEFWTHAHSPEMSENAREWRYNLQHTDPRYVSVCLDLDWVHQGGQDPLALLREAGARVASLHLRNSTQKLWLEALGDGDIDYRQVAAYLKQAGLRPLLVVELAYRKETAVTRPLEDDLRLSRMYAERVFGVSA
jgi:inosose dehydratase